MLQAGLCRQYVQGGVTSQHHIYVYFILIGHTDCLPLTQNCLPLTQPLIHLAADTHQPASQFICCFCQGGKPAGYVLQQTFSRSPCKFLMAGKCLPLRLCNGTVSDPWKTGEIPTGHISPQCNATRGNPNLYLDQPIIKELCQPIGEHVSYSTDGCDTTRFGPCSSLFLLGQCCCPHHQDTTSMPRPLPAF